MKNNCSFYPFIKAAQGNWRNALFISCKCNTCPFGITPDCEGYLLVSDSMGFPIIISIEQLRAITGEPVDPHECCGEVSLASFQAVYAQYIKWSLSQKDICPLPALSWKTACTHISNP